MMRNIFIPGLLVLLFYSCESDLETTGLPVEFKMIFSEGTVLHQDDVLHYDSSTHLIYLKENLVLDKEMSDFAVLAGTDTIYKGVLHSCLLSSMPRTAHYINDCFIYADDILAIRHWDMGADMRNDPRIIHAFQSREMLHHGISCRIDNLVVERLTDQSRVTCTIKVRNHDDFAYYIPDPKKMGNLKFNYYTGGISFYNEETHSYSFLRWSENYPDYGNLSMQDFSVLKGGHEVTYTFSSDDYHPIYSGAYQVLFRFSGMDYRNELNRNRPEGTIWIGTITAILKEYEVD